MNGCSKLKNLPTEIYELEKVDEVGFAMRLVGNADIVPTYSDGQAVFGSGQIVSVGTGVVGTLNLKNIPHDLWPHGKPVGAPRQDQKHLRTFLLWVMYLGQLGGKRGLADDATASELGYSEGRKVRKIRNAHLGKLNADVNDILCIENNSSGQDCIDGEGAALIESAAWEKRADGSYAVSGSCWILKSEAIDSFIPGYVEATAKNNAANAKDLDRVANRKGPVIISFIKPGRK